MRPHSSLAIGLLLFNPFGPRGIDHFREEPVLVQRHLALELAIDYESGSLAGSALLTLENAGRDPADDVSLLLGRLMQVSDVRSDTGGSLDWAADVVTFADWPAYQVVEIRVRLPRALPPGDSTTVRVDYGGVLVGYTETGMQYVRDRVSRDFTIIRSDALAFPVPGRASFASLRNRLLEDFTFEVELTVPDPGQVVAGAAPAQRLAGNADGVTWRLGSQAPAPFLLITVAPYEVIRRGSTTVFHFPADETGARRLADEAEAARAYYGEWFGPPPAAHPLTIMEIPEGWGSQASLTGGIIQTADAFRDGDALPQLYHELAHIWHPRELERPADRWNEGLATFLQWRVAAERNPEENLAERMASILIRVRDEHARSPIVVPMTEYGEEGSTGRSYRVGALMFDALFRELGQAAFDRCLGDWFSDYAGSGSNNDDFIRSMTGCDERAGPVLADWLTSSRWSSRLDPGA